MRSPCLRALHLVAALLQMMDAAGQPRLANARGPGEQNWRDGRRGHALDPLDERVELRVPGLDACLEERQTLLFLLRESSRDLVVPGQVEGGTHNPWAPPFDFLSTTFLPLLEKMGARVTASLTRYGFYPAGGGEFVVHVEPATRLSPLSLLHRGELVARKGTVLCSSLPAHVGKREKDQLVRRLSWPGSAFEVVQVTESRGPGNIVLVELQFETLTEVFTAFGEKGIPVPRVIDPLVKEVRAYLASEAPVGTYLADQLLIPLAMAGGGSFRAVGLSRHTTTNMAVIEAFLETTIQTERRDRGDVLVSLTPTA